MESLQQESFPYTEARVISHAKAPRPEEPAKSHLGDDAGLGDADCCLLSELHF